MIALSCVSSFSPNKIPCFSSIYAITNFVTFVYIYHPQTNLRDGNVFTPVCQSILSTGVCPRMHLDRGCSEKGRGKRWCGEGVYTPPPPPNTTSDGHQSRQYASYWNAFLFQIVIVLIKLRGNYLSIEGRVFSPAWVAPELNFTEFVLSIT